jgi:ankyrin repeat protein
MCSIRNGKEATVTDLDRMGRDVLHYAAADNDVDTVRQRLADGAPVDLREKRVGYTPLLFAVQEGAVEAARVLLDAGADVAITVKVGAVTPLHVAVECWRKSVDGRMIRLLLDYGAEKAAQASIGWTPRDFAAGLRNFPHELAELLEP